MNLVSLIVECAGTYQIQHSRNMNSNSISSAPLNVALEGLHNFSRYDAAITS